VELEESRQICVICVLWGVVEVAAS
jgi:hypothetical protein